MRAAFKEPFERFAQIYAQAEAAQPKDPSAVTLATVDAQGRPSARVVLMRGFDERGFTFFTNRDSRKGTELKAQKVAALCFYWPALDIQVRVEGTVGLVNDTESDAYFSTRARLSQLGAWASFQSQPLGSRSELVGRLEQLRQRYDGGDVPRPPHWGGFRVVPERIEFWKAGEFRLHDRSVYERDGDGWNVTLLNP
jgi:pyridoxamine 5'-phosphate oxidase